MQDSRCQSCGLKSAHCICKTLAAVPSSTQVTVVMHARERQRATNSGKLLAALLANAKVLTIGASADSPLDLESLIHPARRNVVLYPGSVRTSPPPGDEPVHLIVPDGNWKEAGKISRRLLAMPGVFAVSLPKMPPSPFILRRRADGMDEGLATLAAVAHFLGEIESSSLREHLLAAFSRFVTSHLEARGVRRER